MGIVRHNQTCVECCELKAQDTTLLQVSQIAKSGALSAHNLHLLEGRLERLKYGGGFLQGIESKTWDLEKGPQEYLTLSSKPADHELDPMSRLLRYLIPNIYHRHWGHKHHSPDNDNLFEYKDSSIHKFIRTISTPLSALLPTLSIFVLYYVRSQPARLGLVLLFTTMFAVVLQLVARARTVEVFAATAA